MIQARDDGGSDDGWGTGVWRWGPTLGLFEGSAFLTHTPHLTPLPWLPIALRTKALPY